MIMLLKLCHFSIQWRVADGVVEGKADGGKVSSHGIAIFVALIHHL